MAISKEGKKVIKNEIREIDRRIDRVQSEIKKVTQDKTALESKLSGLIAIKDKLEKDAGVNKRA